MGSSCESGHAAFPVCCIRYSLARHRTSVVVDRTLQWAGDQLRLPRAGDGSSAHTVRNSALAETPQMRPSQSLDFAWDEPSERTADTVYTAAKAAHGSSLVVRMQRCDQGLWLAADGCSQLTASPTCRPRRAASPPRISRIPATSASELTVAREWGTVLAAIFAMRPSAPMNTMSRGI